MPIYAFPGSHRRKLRSTNPLERLNKEIGRRTERRRRLPERLVLAGPDDHTDNETTDEVPALLAA